MLTLLVALSTLLASHTVTHGCGTTCSTLISQRDTMEVVDAIATLRTVAYGIPHPRSTTLHHAPTQICNTWQKACWRTVGRLMWSLYRWGEGSPERTQVLKDIDTQVWCMSLGSIAVYLTAGYRGQCSTMTTKAPASLHCACPSRFVMCAHIRPKHAW